MPRRSRTLGAGSQGPLRGIANLLKNLTPEQQDKLRSAFSDAEDLLSFHSLNSPEKQQIRRISGLVQQLVITATSSIIGGFVSWSRLDDPRISLYEVQTSDDNVFSAPETFQVLNTFFAIEGITNTKFVRVRGVRIDGEAGLWSAVKSIKPNLVAPKAHSIEFYPTYGNQSDPSLQRTITYGSATDSNYQDFYTILSHSFYVDRISGGLSIWGSISNKLKTYTDPGKVPWDRVRFTVNGIHRMDSYFPHWTNAFDIDNPNKNDFINATPGDDYITFYAKAGYTASFGPYAVAIPNTLAGVGPKDPGRVTKQDKPDGTFYWLDVDNARRPAIFDEAQLPSPTSLSNTTAKALHEASTGFMSSGGKSHWIVFQNFGFDIDEYSRVLGIEAEVKRRQPNIQRSIIETNYGIVRPDKDLGDDLVLEYKVVGSGSGATALAEEDILDDVGFGKYLDLSTGHKNISAIGSGVLIGDPTGDGDDASLPGTLNDRRTKLWTGNKITLSCWFVVPADLNSGILNNRNPRLFAWREISGSAGNPGGAGNWRISLNSTGTAIDQYFFIVGSDPGTAFPGTTRISYNPGAGLNSQLGTFHHVAVSYNGDEAVIANRLKMYVNGVSVGTTAVTSWSEASFTDTIKLFTIGMATAVATESNSPLGMSQFGIWNKVLDLEEITDMFKARGFADYRFPFGAYSSQDSLQHYFLFFPDNADIRDKTIVLTDRTGFRTDLDNKAQTDESWPILGNFFYTDIRQFGILPLATSDGIPHDNHTAIGYQKYGNSLDLWGATEWYARDINNFYFGFAVQAINDEDAEFNGAGFIDHARMTVYTEPIADRQIDVAIEAAIASHFYIERMTFSGLINALEVGELIAEDAS